MDFTLLRFCLFISAPFFTVSILKNSKTLTKIATSPVNDVVKKGDTSVYINLAKPLPVCGDVLVEFFNKPKMMKKVDIKVSQFIQLLFDLTDSDQGHASFI